MTSDTKIRAISVAKRAGIESMIRDSFSESLRWSGGSESVWSAFLAGWVISHSSESRSGT